MRLLFPALVIAALAAVPPAAADASMNPKSAPTGKYMLDPNHTVITFCITHMGVSSYCGRFNKVSGDGVFVAARPEKSSIAVTIDTASVDTTSDKLDGMLRDQFFETAKFPTATFKTTAIKVTGETTGEITGDLTLHGVTKPVMLTATFTGGRAHMINGRYLLGFQATASLKRADFAFPDVAWSVFVGDEVALRIDAELQADQ